MLTDWMAVEMRGSTGYRRYGLAGEQAIRLRQHSKAYLIAIQSTVLRLFLV